MLGLRIEEGVDLEEAAIDLRAPGWTAERRQAALWLEQRGRLVVEDSRLRIPREAWLWADDTAARLF
jgi:oxygen-independent coproporphyrinogen-3 oxidase